jgi:hypothetical protein
MSAAFYCVADASYFLGAVGLVNSLRLVGHTEAILLLDCGLTAEQRSLLEGEVEIVPGPTNSAPHVLKAIAPRQRPAEAMALIDADMIVSRHLGGLLDEARDGRVIAGGAEMERFCPEWGELLDLGDVRPAPYVSTGLVVCGGRLGRELVELVDDRRDVVDFELTFWRRNVADYPLLHADQDLINAVLSARAADEEIRVFDPRLSASPPFAGLEIVDEASLRCAYDDGTEPYVVHHWLAKPWLEPTEDGVYSRLLRRLLDADDVPVRVPERLVPLRLRRGLRGYAARKRIDAGKRLGRRTRRALARG